MYIVIVLAIQFCVLMMKALFFVCRVVFELAFKLRLGFCLTYLVVVALFFEPWARAHNLLALAILIALAVLGLGSWIVTLVLFLKRRKAAEYEAYLECHRRARQLTR